MRLHRFLMQVTWVGILPMVLLSGYLALDSLRSAEAGRDREAARLARQLATVVDQHLEARSGALEMLAASPLVDDASRRSELYQEAEGFVRSFGSHVILADLGMQMLLNTRVPLGAELPRLPKPAGHSAVAAALETGKPAVGDSFLGPIARERLVAMAVPALRDGRPAFLVLTTLEVRQFQERFDRVLLPPGWSLALLDGGGEAMARIGAPAGPRSGPDDGSRWFVARPQAAPWKVVLEVRGAVRRAALLRSAAALGIAVLGATVVSVLGSVLASRRIGRAVASLARKPSSPGHPPVISEIADVKRRLDESAAERERAEAALRESERRFRATFEQAAVGIAMVAPDGRWLQVNQKLCDIVGRSREELLALTFQQITHPDDVDRDVALVKRVLEGEVTTYQMEKRYVRKGGALVWINLTVALVRREDGSPDYFISVIEDVERRRKAEEELRLLAATLEQRVELRTAELTAANQELERFAHAVSHDLRAPVRVIDGYSQALAEELGEALADEARGHLEKIGVATRKMAALIDGLLTLAHNAHGALREDVVDVSATAERLLAELAAADPGRRVTTEVEPGLVAHGDARMVESVMRNLLGNAWKYTARAEAPSIRVHAEQRDGTRFFCVADNGAGFDMEQAARLFRPFQRLHRDDEFPGLGIGLATVRSIVERHGGVIEARGEPGRGALFAFSLPGRPAITPSAG